MIAPARGQISSRPPAFRRWDVAAAELAAGLLFIPLPKDISPGPGWLPAVLIALLLVPATLVQEAYHRPGGWTPPQRMVRLLGLSLLGILAVAEALALALLLHNLPRISVGQDLFRSAALLWAINVLVFALCYWELDGGGPTRRGYPTCRPGDFLFPQQTDPQLNAGWAPEFLDYLFLAFNTATAFSPTDTMILSRPAKALMMVQAGIALLTIALVAARGVNIIGSK